MNLDPVNLWHKARLRPVQLWRYRPWQSGHAQALLANTLRAGPLRDDRTHLLAAAAWLERAQDVTTDGGIAARYRLRNGWSSSYPETTGYIVPTLLALARELDPRFRARAARAIAFLLAVQLPDGAFPGGEIASNQSEPSPFNTAQIINGLLAWHAETGSADCLSAARRAGDWLVSVQDADGAWTRYFHRQTPACYSAHLSCFLADLAETCDDARYRDSVSRHLDWVLGHRNADTDWFERTGFSPSEQSLRIADLHTVAYTLAGLLHSALLLGRDDIVSAVRAAAGRVADTQARLGWLPGVLDWQWQARADSACLTGNAQMALIWMRLHDIDGDGARDWLTPAWRAIDSVKRAQLLDSSNPDLRGGIPGPTPMWGWYNDGALPNWAAKFFIDALLAKAAIEGARA